MMRSLLVIPAQAGIQPDYLFGKESIDGQTAFWIPAFAGMTKWVGV